MAFAVRGVTKCYNSFWYAILEVIQGLFLFIWFRILPEIQYELEQRIFLQFFGTVLIRRIQLFKCELFKSYFCKSFKPYFSKLFKSYFCLASAQLSG